MTRLDVDESVTVEDGVVAVFDTVAVVVCRAAVAAVKRMKNTTRPHRENIFTANKLAKICHILDIFRSSAEKEDPLRFVEEYGSLAKPLDKKTMAVCHANAVAISK